MRHWQAISESWLTMASSYCIYRACSKSDQKNSAIDLQIPPSLPSLMLQDWPLYGLLQWSDEWGQKISKDELDCLPKSEWIGPAQGSSNIPRRCKKSKYLLTGTCLAVANVILVKSQLVRILPVRDVPEFKIFDTPFEGKLIFLQHRPQEI